jgi:hypothetical protein
MRYIRSDASLFDRTVGEPMQARGLVVLNPPPVNRIPVKFPDWLVFAEQG